MTVRARAIGAQGCVDQWFLKYLATCVGWPVLAVPFLLSPGEDVGEMTARYREFDSLMQSSSAAIGDLMMVYKKTQRLAGYTARVVELLEAVDPARGGGASAAGTVGAMCGDALSVDDKPSILFQCVTIHAPDGRLLLKARTPPTHTCPSLAVYLGGLSPPPSPRFFGCGAR